MVLGTLVAPAMAQGPSWPQWQGPTRDNVCPEKGLLGEWPKDGPKLLWQVDGVGEGYSTPTMANGLIFGLSYQGDDEVVWARSLEGGKPIWTRRIGSANRKLDYNQGSRGSATIDGELLYAVGASGDFVCLALKDGAVVWQKNLVKDFGGTIPFYVDPVRKTYGYTESPLIDGDLVLVTPGNPGQTIVALDKKKGDLRWSASAPEKRFKGDTRAGYCSLMMTRVGGVKQYIQFLQGCLIAVDDAGKLLWRWDKPSCDIAHCSTPLVNGDLVFATSGYGRGCGLGKIVVKDGAANIEEVYFNKAMRNVHGGMVLVDGHVYGNCDPGFLVCLELLTGKVKWQERSAGRGSILYADGRLYYHDEDGPMLLVEATPTKYLERGRFQSPGRSRSLAWSHPVILEGRLYVRDQDFLMCYDVKRPSP